MPATSAADLIQLLRAIGDPANAVSRERFGCRPRNEQLGCTMAQLREVARAYRGDHALALALWEIPIHEAHLLAALVADPKQLTAKKMNEWIADFDSWDICDQMCIGPFRRTPHAFAKVDAWAGREPEFERRAAFALLAALAVHEKLESDATFLDRLPLIEHAATDGRNFVRKAVSWALRQIGKRQGPSCRPAALALAERLAAHPDSPSARWIGHDAARELRK